MFQLRFKNAFYNMCKNYTTAYQFLSKSQVSSDNVCRYCTCYQGVGEAKNVNILLSYLVT